MSESTPLARSKTAALVRVTDIVPKGYCRWIAGRVKASKAEALAGKFHQRFAIGATPAQRLTRKRKGIANAALIMYWPEGAEMVEWLILATPGTGFEGEVMRDVAGSHRLVWLDYELVRHATRGRAAWTWRRTKADMSLLHALLADQLNRRHYDAVAETLQRIAHQPGFHGVREQSWALFREALIRGYPGELPFLFFVQKVPHGDRLLLPQTP